jgi:hypothetical protein
MILSLREDQYKVLDSRRGKATAVQAEGITNQDIALGAAVGSTFGFMLLVGGKIIGTALVLSIASIGGATILYIKLPSKAEESGVMASIVSKLPISRERRQRLLSWDWKKSMERHEIACDVAISVGAVFVFGTTLSGLLAAAVTGIGFSAMIRVVNICKRLNRTRTA